MTILEKRPIAKTFYCISCQREQPMEQLGKTIKSNRSKRCQGCCDRANEQRARLARGMVA